MGKKMSKEEDKDDNKESGDEDEQDKKPVNFLIGVESQACVVIHLSKSKSGQKLLVYKVIKMKNTTIYLFRSFRIRFILECA